MTPSKNEGCPQNSGLLSSAWQFTEGLTHRLATVSAPMGWRCCLGRDGRGDLKRQNILYIFSYLHFSYWIQKFKEICQFTGWLQQKWNRDFSEHIIRNTVFTKLNLVTKQTDNYSLPQGTVAIPGERVEFDFQSYCITIFKTSSSQQKLTKLTRKTEMYGLFTRKKKLTDIIPEEAQTWHLSIIKDSKLTLKWVQRADGNHWQRTKGN